MVAEPSVWNDTPRSFCSIVCCHSNDLIAIIRSDYNVSVEHRPVS